MNLEGGSNLPLLEPSRYCQNYEGSVQRHLINRRPLLRKQLITETFQIRNYYLPKQHGNKNRKLDYKGRFEMFSWILQTALARGCINPAILHGGT
jgi:hypothetical protein